MTTNIFLSRHEVSELSGIRTSTLDKPLHQLQSEALQRMGVPHYVNAIQRVIVARAVIENGVKVAPRAGYPSGMNVDAIK